MKSNAEAFNYFLDFGGKNKVSGLPQGDENGSDNEKLLHCQWKYLAEKDEKSFVKLWMLFTELCKRAVKKEIKTKRFFLDYDEVCFKADLAAEYVLRRYRTYEREKGETYVVKNFIAAAHDGVMHALYSEVENDFYLEMCKTLNGKPVKEIGRRGCSLKLKEEPKEQEYEKDLEGQLLLF